MSSCHLSLAKPEFYTQNFRVEAPESLPEAVLTQILDTAGTFALRFAQAQWAVTPGQSAVLYDGEVCLGGGVIAAAGD